LAALVVLVINLGLLAWLQALYFVLFFAVYIALTLALNAAWKTGWTGIARRSSTRRLSDFVAAGRAQDLKPLAAAQAELGRFHRFHGADAARTGQRHRAARQLHNPRKHHAAKRALQLIGDLLDHGAHALAGRIVAAEQAAAGQRRPDHRRHAQVLQAVEGFVEHRRHVQRREFHLIGRQRNAAVQAFELVAAEVGHAEVLDLAILAQRWNAPAISSKFISGSGRWISSRSRWSVPSWRSECSAEAMMWLALVS
jgi:hypothetical protein